eukprot:TRINITY_DN7041_c1_g1_i2.p1 TRINITY_DN7041_c1_g1~~TRINITY_DN7041_c1_g1_i2.p1  ORF type:complete len:227 (-),score=36.93 TRINITY_DN7041_c1_g1_i2:278-958(-)
MFVAPVRVLVSSPRSLAYDRGRPFSSSVRPCPCPPLHPLTKSPPFRTLCIGKENHDASTQEFSVLSSDIPWDTGGIWSTMGLYFFSFHIPLSFGGLSVIAQMLHQPVMDPLAEDVNNPALKEILSSGSIAKAACVFIYCFITPVLEETVYRGFLLTSLATTMEWRRAVAISACVFTAAHLSWENSPQLFLIGCVLGSAYCWTGNLASSFTIHAAYNAATLLVTMVS